jgi:hypothetical protein
MGATGGASAGGAAQALVRIAAGGIDRGEIPTRTAIRYDAARDPSEVRAGRERSFRSAESERELAARERMASAQNATTLQAARISAASSGAGAGLAYRREQDGLERLEQAALGKAQEMLANGAGVRSVTEYLGIAYPQIDAGRRGGLVVAAQQSLAKGQQSTAPSFSEFALRNAPSFTPKENDQGEMAYPNADSAAAVMGRYYSRVTGAQAPGTGTPQQRDWDAAAARLRANKQDPASVLGPRP